MRKLSELAPRHFRILFRQFLGGVIDLEALSIEADIPRFLGQLASVLVLISVLTALGMLMSYDTVAKSPQALLRFSWRLEQGMISATMLVVGLIAIFTWDSTFPDRKDALVLSPLPVRPRTVLLAKISASAAILGLAIVALNFATGVLWPLFAGAQHRSIVGFLQSFAAYWFAIVGAGIFVYGSVLTVQGLTSLLLPRWFFLRVSAMLQIAAFGLLLAGYFLRPSLVTAAAISLPEHHGALAWFPSFWFFALFNQVNGTLPVEIAWLPGRAWAGLGIVVTGAGASLLLSYLRTMRKIAEEPDLVKARGVRWAPRFGNALHTAIMRFSLRSLLRSRQHRLAFAFFLSLICAITLYWVRVEVSVQGPMRLNPLFVVATFMIMAFAVFGLRSVFSLPISLNANWVLRATQLRPSDAYIAATRRVLLVLGVAPAWMLSALLAAFFRPLSHVAVHLAILAIVGWIFAEVSLINFYKVPFTCSYLPGKLNPVMFGYFLMVVFQVSFASAMYELPSLNSPIRCATMVTGTAAVGVSLWIFNRRRARSAVLYFEELPPQVITTLGIASIRVETPPQSSA